MAVKANEELQRSRIIGDLWICDYLSTPNPRVEIGIWDQDAEATVSLEELIELRRFITQIIIKRKQ